MSFPSRSPGLRLCTALIPACLALAGFAAPASSQQSYAPSTVTVNGFTDPVSAQVGWAMHPQAQPIGFEIYRRVYAAGPLANHSWSWSDITDANLLTQVAANAPKVWDDQPVEAGMVLNYTVCAIFANNVPKGCNEAGAQVVINDGSYIPLANRPTEGEASPLDHQRMTVSWKDNSPNEDGFAIHRHSGTSTGPEIGRVSSNVTEWVHTGLSANTTYRYQVCAIPPGGDTGTVCTTPFHGTTASPPPPPKPPAAPNTPTDVRAAQVADYIAIQVEWNPGSGDGDPAEEIRVRVRRTHGGPLTGIVLAAPAFREITHTQWTDNRDEQGRLLSTSIAVGPNETWQYRVCPYNDVGESCANAVSASVRPLPSLPVEQLSGSSTAVNQQHAIALTWLDPNVFAHGEVRTEIALWSDRMNGFTTVNESAREMSPGQEPTPTTWTDRGSHLRSDQAYRYRVCTLNLPVQGTDRRCRETVVRTVDAGLDAGAVTLRAHLEELRAVDVRVLRTDGRSLLPAGETCTSCPWQIGTRELRTSLERAGVRGEVNLVLLNARGGVVAELGRFPVARDGSIPGLGRDLQVQGRLPVRTGEQCGLTLRVADGRGQSLADVPFCVNRTGGP